MESINQLWHEYSPLAINFAIALAYLLAFYIAASILRSITRKVLHKTELDNKFLNVVGLKANFPVENLVGGIVFWLVMFFGLVTFFEKLALEAVAQPISTFLTEIFAYLPKFGAAIGLLIVAWILASVVKMLINKGADLLGVDRRLNELDSDGEVTTAGEEASAEGGEQFTVGHSLATAGYWFIFLLFLPIVLGTLGMESLVTPLQDMFSKLFTYLPNIFSAALIFVVGNFVARIVRKIVSSLLAATGVDNFSAQVGLQQGISGLVGTLAFTVILLLVIVQSLDALKIDAISGPARQMIDMIFLAVPGIVAAALVLTVSYFIGKLLAGIVTDLLTAANFNDVTEKIGLKTEMAKTPSQYVGSLVMLGVILFAILGATELIGFKPLGVIVSNLIYFAFRAVLAAVILGFGIVVANKVRELVNGSGINTLSGNLARVAILVLTTAMALRQLGLAEDIINLAFGLLFGAIALGLAIAIGLGSKDAVGEEVADLIRKMKS